MGASATPKANQLLAALPESTYRRLLPHLEAVTLTLDQCLFPRAGPLPFAYFPTGCIVTLSYAIEKGAMAKAWPVGREGMVGISLILGNARRSNRAEVQVTGAAYRIAAAPLLAEFRRGDALLRLILRYVSALITQASQLSVCGQHHRLDQRLCRFLSRAFDRVSGDRIFITQARIGKLLGVRRGSITEVALGLQKAGIIRYFRGDMMLINREKLEERACTCGAIIRRAFEAVSD